MSKLPADGLTGYTLPTGHVLSAWSKGDRNNPGWRRTWRQKGHDVEAAYVNPSATFYQARMPQGLPFELPRGSDTSGGATNVKDAKLFADNWLRKHTALSDKYYDERYVNVCHSK